MREELRLQEIERDPRVQPPVGEATELDVVIDKPCGECFAVGQPELRTPVEGRNGVTQPGDEIGVDDLFGPLRTRVGERCDDDDRALSRRTLHTCA